VSAFTNRALPEVLSFIVDNRGRSCPTAESGFPLIATNCLREGERYPTFENIRHVSEETRQSWFRAHPEPGDVLLVCKGSPGRVAVVPDPVPFCIAQDMVALRANSELVHPGYLYYRLKAPDVQRAIPNLHVGTMIPHFKKGDFGKLRFDVHDDLSEQRAIAEVLGALDDKIAANAELAVRAEDLMAATYERSLLAGARQAPLGTVAEFHNRRRVPLSARQREQRVGPVPYYGATGVFGYVDEALFDERLVLVGEDGSVVLPDGLPVVQYVWGPAWVNNHAHVLTGVGLSTEVLRLAIQRTNVAPIVTGAVQPKISMGNLRGLTLDIPGQGQMSAVEPEVDALCAVVRAKVEESRTLTNMRDTLLPQLMAGKIRVRDAERVFEGVV